MTKAQRFIATAFRIVLLISMVLATFMPSAPRSAQAGYDPTFDWDFDSGFETGMLTPGHFDLEMDGSGYPHLAYFKDGAAQDWLIYRYYDGVQWLTGLETVTSSPLALVSLELDEANHPHILAYGEAGIPAFYTFYDGTAWSSTPLPFAYSAAQGGYAASLGLTGAGLPVIAFYNVAGSAISLATFNGAIFTVESVDSGATYRFVTMVVDEGDQPHIAYCQVGLTSGCASLKYATKTGSGWQITTVEASAALESKGNYASIALDSLGMPNLSYVNSSMDNVSVQHARFTEHGWTKRTVESWRTSPTGGYTAIALNEKDQPYIAYYDAYNQNLDFRWWDGSAWNNNMDPDADDMGTYINLELDSLGNPFLAFWDTTVPGLTLAHYTSQPDLAVSQFWQDPVGLIAVVRNDGQAAYTNEVGVELYVDGSKVDEAWAGSAIDPGETISFTLDAPTCASTSMQVEVRLLGVHDYNPANDSLSETWACDASPLVISGFSISGISQTGFSADWTTNRPADSTLRYTLADGRSGLVESNASLVTNHHVEISGLQPHQVYYAQAFSADAAGLTARSARKTVKTLAGSTPPPVATAITSERLDTPSETYQFEATYPDTTNIERVEFRLDGKLIGTDYTPEGGAYSLQFAPGVNGYTREDFFGVGHQLTTNAFSYNTSIAPGIAEELLEFQRENFPIDSALLTPDAESTLTIVDATVPVGTSQEINVFARQFEWECEYGGADNQPVCEDVAHPVSEVKFYINDVLRGSDITPVDGVYMFPWNLAGVTPGDYRIKAVVKATDGGTQEHNAVLHIVYQQTILRIDQSLFREDNTFRVHLRIFNDSSSFHPVEIRSVRETMQGLQPISLVYSSYEVVASTSQWGDTATADLTPNTPETLEPGEMLEFYFNVVPILYPNMETAQYSLGSIDVSYNLLGNPKTTSFVKQSQVWDGGSIPLEQSVANAFATSDYLLITAPSALKDLYVDADADRLMADMAHLAMLKKGILAYWNPALGKESLDLLLQDNSPWTSRLHPKFSQQYGGYVLLVGETEVIPSATTGPFDNGVPVKYSDHYYSATDSGEVLAPPDLLVGRAVGNSAADLDKVILNSLLTHLYGSYERAQAYVGSGREFGGVVDGIQADLGDTGYDVSLHHYADELYFQRYSGINFTQHDGLTHGDVDGDGTEEIIWAQDSSNQVFFVEPTDGNLSFGFNLDFEDGDSLAAGDVDADPQLEIVIADLNDTIRTYDVNGAQVASFNVVIDAWDKIAVGDVLYSHSGSEIVLAKKTDDLYIYTEQGVLLAEFDLQALGYYFSNHDQLKIGNLTDDNGVGPNEIILTDLVSDRVIVITAAGVVKETYTVAMQVGDTLEVANLTGEAFDNIVIINSETGDLKAINYGTVTPLHGGEFDGLVMTDMAGSVTDHVFHLDQDGHLDWLDMDYPAYSRQLFTDSMGGVDLVWMYAHGAPDGIWPIINSSLPDDFAGSHPIINAWSCHTGNYEGHGDDGFSEAFLQAGAGVFIGSTEVSLSVENNMVNRNFYKEYWNLAGWNLAEALARRESDLLQNAPGNLFMGWWVNEYNYYGDPKFDIFTDTTLKAPEKAQTLDAKQALVIDLPMYSLSQQDGYDFVEIPADAGLGTHAGTHYLEYDQYQVPIYIHTLEIPAGQEVQNVSLSNLANVSAAWGLQLPVSEYQIVSEASNPLARPVTASKEISAVPGHDWAPGFEQPFDWTVIHHVEGGSTLKLVLYPFNYDPAALYSEYSRHFEFNIETVATSVAITKASTDQAQYRLGEDILLSLELSNTDTLAVDAVVSAVLRAGGSGETLDGFTLSGLNGLLGKAQLQLIWTWADGLAVPPGDYSIEITVENLAGQRLASRNVGLRLGETAGELSQLAVTPQNFQPGDLIGIQLDFANTGELPIDGEAVIQVQTLAGEILSELVAPISGLAAGSVAAVPYSWDSSGVAEGDYQVVGFVRYDSQTTPAVVQSITTLERVYLPLIRR